MNVYMLAMACVVHGSCAHGYFLLGNPALVSCEGEVMPMIEGRRVKNKNGETVIWHAESCVTQDSPPKNRQMMGMF